MRRQARELALQILFQTEFSNQITFEDMFSLLGQRHEGSIVRYADDLVRGVQAHKIKIDAKIQEASRNWKIERMGSVDRNLLRVAVFEMMFSAETIEPKIAINEAIEIAKIYGNQDSPGFINGILDQVVRNERQ